MSQPLKLLPAAASDLSEARDWYEQRRQGLGREFVLEVDKTLDSVSVNPNAHAAGYHLVRQALVDRFPYIVFYRIAEREIEVLAILHAKRNPRVWRSRA